MQADSESEEGGSLMSSHDDSREDGQDEEEARKRHKCESVERHHRALVRRVQRAFIEHLITNQTGVIDNVRPLVDVPADAGHQFWGASIRALANPKKGEIRLIRRIGFVVSTRPERHGDHNAEWTLACTHNQARHWLNASRADRRGAGLR